MTAFTWYDALRHPLLFVASLLGYAFQSRRFDALPRLRSQGTGMARAIADTPSTLPVRGCCLGCDEELADFTASLASSKSPSRLAILGAGGIGKTSLAIAVSHAPAVADRFNKRRYWIDLEGVSEIGDFVKRVAAGLPVSSSSTIADCAGFLAASPSLLCLDDVDALAGRPSTRNALTKAVETLGSMCWVPVTLRDSRGLHVSSGWSQTVRLGRLAPDAAADAFCLVADTHRDDPDLQQLVKDCDGLPLAIMLLSCLATPGLPLCELRKSWARERSRLLSQGSTKHDNIAISVNLSLEHPSMRCNEDAWNVIRALAASTGTTLSRLEALLGET